MEKDSIVISKILLEGIIKENERLKNRVSELEGVDKNKPMEGQISIEEYTKTLKLQNKSSKGGK